MTPSWKPLAKVKVSAQPEGLWNKIIPYVCGPRLLQLTAVDSDDKGNQVSKCWELSKAEECNPDGALDDPKQQQPAEQKPQPLLVSIAPRGALVGKVGGSTADLPDTSPAATTTPYPGSKVFVSGSYAVIALAGNESGPLFLTMNDSPSGFRAHSGEIWVLVEEAPL
jgi:hypothetical protein